MANGLFERQNNIVILKSLVAQRRLYSSAKHWGYTPKIMAILLAVIAFFWQMGNSKALSWIVSVISFVGWGTALLGEKYGEMLRRKAARIQQFIDREIFKEAFTAEELVSWSDIPLAGELSEENAKVTEADVEKPAARASHGNVNEDNFDGAQRH